MSRAGVLHHGYRVTKFACTVSSHGPCNTMGPGCCPGRPHVAAGVRFWTLAPGRCGSGGACSAVEAEVGSWPLWRRTGDGSSRGSSRLLTCPLLCCDSVWVDSAENCGVPAVASFVILRCSSSPWTRLLVTCPCCASRGSPSVHGSFWMNFLRFLRECRLRS